MNFNLVRIGQSPPLTLYYTPSIDLLWSIEGVVVKR